MNNINTLPEEPFIINGVKSWIHCLVCETDHPIDDILPHHYHDYIELLYPIDTNAYVWLNGEKHKFDSENLIIINSQEPHTLTFEGASKYICIKFLPQILYADENSLFEFKYVLPFLLENSQYKKIFHKDELADIDVHSLIIEIMDEWNKKNPAYELIIRSNILRIFTGIFRYWHNGNSFSGEANVEDIVKMALRYVETNFDTVTEHEVADYCNVSYNYFSYIFKKTMGKTFIDYITFLRIREAEKLLLSTDKSITEIAFACGFSTSSYFIHKFKSSKGITPKQFRKNTRNTTL